MYFETAEKAIKELFGQDCRILRREPAYGGDINISSVLSLSDGRRVFMKENRKPVSFFEAEERGLRAIRETGTIRVPEVLACGGTDRESFLLMEMIEPAPKIRGYDTVFGEEFAAMHLADASSFVPGGKYGFTEDNYISARVQRNRPHGNWAEFFREERLLPQLRDAAGYFRKEDRAAFDRLMEDLEAVLPEPEKPALLHGDLWGGNYMTGSDGKAWLIDPAVYVGDPEADLAMTELFGGFSGTFYSAYHGVIPKRPGYEGRREVYQLYHLLNHLNLFGGGYLSSCRHAVTAALRIL